MLYCATEVSTMNSRYLSELLQSYMGVVLGVSLLVIIFLMIKHIFFESPRKIAYAHFRAGIMAARCWQVVSKTLISFRGAKWRAGLVLKNKAWPDKKTVIFVTANHPDILQFENLNEQDEVHFDFLDEPLEGISPANPTAYLRFRM